jgi:uncharacterized membrane protein YesL
MYLAKVYVNFQLQLYINKVFQCFLVVVFPPKRMTLSLCGVVCILMRGNII